MVYRSPAIRKAVLALVAAGVGLPEIELLTLSAIRLARGDPKAGVAFGEAISRQRSPFGLILRLAQAIEQEVNRLHDQANWAAGDHVAALAWEPLPGWWKNSDADPLKCDRISWFELRARIPSAVTDESIRTAWRSLRKTIRDTDSEMRKIINC